MEVDGEGGRGGGVDNAKNGLSPINIVHLGARHGNEVAAPLRHESTIIICLSLSTLVYLVTVLGIWQVYKKSIPRSIVVAADFNNLSVFQTTSILYDSILPKTSSVFIYPLIHTCNGYWIVSSLDLQHNSIASAQTSTVSP